MQRKNVTPAIIRISDEQKKAILEEIEAYYLDVRGDKIGLIEQHQILDLFLENLAPIIYNKALDDVKAWSMRQFDDMESDYYSLYKDN